MKPRAERPYRKQGGCAVVLAVALVALLPAFYVASLGPAVWLVDQGYVDDDTILLIYAPLKLAYDKSDLVRAVLDRYLALWAP